MKEYVKKKLAQWAHHVYLQNNPIVIAITGSTAKTSTKEAIAAVLEEKYRGEVFSSPGNLNSEFGLPLAILGFKKHIKYYRLPWILLKGWMRSRSSRPYPKYWVLEMGSDKPRDISYLTKIVKPNIAVITTVGPAHLQALETIEGVFQEKSDLVRAVDKDGAVFLNKNNPYVAKMRDLSQAKVILYDPLPDEIAQEAARAVGKYFDVSEKQISHALINNHGMVGRMRLLGGKNNSWIIDDCYNANPLSMKVALYKLNIIAKEKGCTRKIAIVGDMLELGDFSKQAHQELKILLNGQVDYIVGIGPLMKELGFDEWYANSSQKNMAILNKVQSGDIILVKGSRSIHLEKVLDKLRKF